MQIHATPSHYYATQSNATQKTLSANTDEAVKQTQQQANTTVAPSNETNKSSQQANTGERLADGKAVQQAEQSLNEAELKKVSELKSRDTEVRAHEAAHLAAAGKYATGGASFEYKRGPDGRSYAVGGEVGIDTSAIPNDPQATLRKAQQIQAAANAPASPSSQDRQVAARAAVMASQARADISQHTVEGDTSESKPDAENTEASSKEIKADSDTQALSENQNKKASDEYQSVADYAEETITPLLQQIA